MNPYYEKLINFDGAQGLDSLIKKWETLSSNIKSLPVEGPIILPDLFVVSHSDTRLSEMIDTLSSYLITKKNLMEFYGDVPYFEFMFNYSGPGSSFTEIKRLMDEVRYSAGFRNVFRGIAHIKIDPWLGHQEEHRFIDFMDYLSQNTPDWLIILSVSPKDSDKVSSMEAVLSMFLRIERITLNKASTATYIADIETRLADYGFELDQSAKELLTESIEVLRKNKYFDTVGTVYLISSDITYEMYSREHFSSSVLTAQDLKMFSKDSIYIQRTLQKIKKRIGFS